MLVLYNVTIEYLQDALDFHDYPNQTLVKGRPIALGISPLFDERIQRAQDMIRRLQATLQPDVAPELCQQLDALYRFLIDQLTIALDTGETAPIDSVLNILTDLRSAWRHAVHEVEEECQ